jgi:predicted phage terminase large subunit-like protein
VYLLGVLRRRMEFPELKRAVFEQAQTYRATVVLIEDKASGTQLIQELINEGLAGVQACKSEHDKIMRLHAQTPRIENGFVYLPREAPWRAAYLHELTTFPNAKYDDQADSTSQALAWLAQRPPEPACFAYLRRDLAVRMRREGLPLPAIAAMVEATPAEVEQWIAEDAALEDEMLEGLLRRDRAPRGEKQLRYLRQATPPAWPANRVGRPLFLLISVRK